MNDLDYELWEIISTMKEGDKIVPKPMSDFSKGKTEKVAKNYRVLNILFCDLNSNKFNHVSICDTTKEVWDILETTYQGTSQV